MVSRSSTEAEFRGMVDGICELLWIKQVLQDLGFELELSMKLYFDNEADVKIANKPVKHDMPKHV